MTKTKKKVVKKNTKKKATKKKVVKKNAKKKVANKNTKKKVANKNTKKKVTKKKMSTKKEKNEKVSLDVYMADGHYYVCWRGPITINEDTHPELKGMSKEEIEEYVKDNAQTMASVDTEYYDNLWDQLMDADYGKDKVLDETYELEFYPTKDDSDHGHHEDDDDDFDDFDDDDE